MQCSRQQLVEILRRTGYPDLADEALKALPDPVDLDEAANSWNRTGDAGRADEPARRQPMTSWRG